LAHLNANEVERLLAGGLPAADRLRAIRHLLSGCRWCRARLGSLADVLFHAEDLGEEPVPARRTSYGKILDRAAAKAFLYQVRYRQDQEGMARALAAARAAPEEERERVIDAEILTLWGWPRVEALLRLSFEERYRDPKRMLELAWAARLEAGNLKAAEHGAALVADFKARAWAELGNAYRVGERFELAETSLAHAEGLLGAGTGDVLLLARVADVQASLRTDQRRLGEALDLLEVVQRLYRDAGDLHLAGRALIKKGIITHYDGEPREAVGLLREGLALLDAGRDPRLAAVGRQDLIHALADCGEFREASRMLLGCGLRLEFAGEPLNLLKLRWMEGKVLAGLGKLGRAERIFEEIREDFHQRGREYDAAMVGLELAAVWLRQGKTQEVGELAEETYEALRDLGIQREALKAAIFLREACRRRMVTLGLLRNVRDFLARLEWHPQLRFAP
jgi:tetratricopeptide (TPR) repeat protein